MSDLQQSKFSLNDRLDLELLNKAVESSLGMVLVVGVTLFVQYRMLNCPGFLKVLSFLLALFAVVRFIYLKRGLGQIELMHSRVQFLRSTVIPMQMFTGMNIGLSLLHIRFEGISTIALLIIVTVVSATSMMTLASNRWLCTGVQTVLIGWVIGPSILIWIETGSSDYAVYLIGYLVYYTFLFRQSATSFQEIKKKYHYEMILEKINVELEESRARVIAETAKAEHASRLAYLGEMAGGMAHEINNPSGIILLLSSKLEYLAQHGPLVPDAVVEIAKKIETNAARIARIIQGLKSFSSNAENAALVSLTVESLWSKISDLMGGRLAQAEIAYEVVHQNPGLILECRVDQIVQAGVNLLNNSIDALVGTDSSWIRVTTQSSGEQIEFRIQDSGHGIPAEIAKKIFNPLFSTKGMNKATGLGLSIGLGLLKQHHGTIFLDSAEVHTTFVMQLPKTQTTVPSNPL